MRYPVAAEEGWQSGRMRRSRKHQRLCSPCLSRLRRVRRLAAARLESAGRAWSSARADGASGAVERNARPVGRARADRALRIGDLHRAGRSELTMCTMEPNHGHRGHRSGGLATKASWCATARGCRSRDGRAAARAARLSGAGVVARANRRRSGRRSANADRGAELAAGEPGRAPQRNAPLSSHG